MTNIARLAAQNNAEWCDAVCRAHGRPGAFNGSLWFNAQKTPRFYPNAVTLVPDCSTELAGIIASLVSANPGGFAVKDSFATLDLESMGFKALFTADWIMHPLGLSHPSGFSQLAGSLAWQQVQTPATLAAWEAAWTDGEPGDRVFPDSLLDDPTVTFIAGVAGERILGGAVLNRSKQVMGWSNVFLPTSDAQACRAGAVAFAATIAGGMPLVGYERDDDLAQSLAIGFEPVGPLRISAYQGVS